MKTNINASHNRGFHENTWLKTWHSFNFGDYFNPLREKFGVVRVLNDEVLAPAASTDFHEYRNLEILIIPLAGELELIEESGNGSIISDSEAQLVSAGKGINYSLTNILDTDPAEYLEVWLFPKSKNTEPALWKNDFYKEDRYEQLQIIACPKICSNALSINQNVWISRIDLKSQSEYDYDLFIKNNQLLIFVIDGSIQITETKSDNFQKMKADARDTVEISDIDRTVRLYAENNCSLLLIETPED